MGATRTEFLSESFVTGLVTPSVCCYKKETKTITKGYSSPVYVVFLSELSPNLK